MKKLLLCLVFAFAIPLVASAQNYIYYAEQSIEYPCCINITAGVNDKDYAGTLIVEIDGVPTYTDLDAENINNIEHCFEGNGIHYVRFYVGEVLYDEYTFDITGCEGDCSVCNLTEIELELSQLDGCNYFMCYRLITVNDVYGYSPECGNETVFWDFGDGTTSDDTPLTNGHFHDFPADGTYTVCLTVTVTNPDGIECSISKCTDVVVIGCDPDPDPCCGLDIGVLDYRVFGSGCLTWLRPVGTSIDEECGAVNYAWTIDGIPTTSFGENLLVTFNGPGPFEVCLTMTQGNCEVFDCVIVDLPDCGKTMGRRVGETQLLSANVYPNPANEYITFDIFTFEETKAQISLINNQGQVIRSYTQQFAADTTQFTINDRSTLSEGVYFYHIQMGNHTKTGKISIFK